MKDKIAKLLSQTNALPVLFIGSGITRRYLGLPNWKDLLKQYCVVGKPFEYYNDKAIRECNDNPDMRLPKAADFIEADFNEKWYTDDVYAESRLQHKIEMEQEISPLKICMAEFFSNATSTVQHQYDVEIEQLKKICNKNVSCIITTNYDCFLEECLGRDNFKVFIGQDDLLFSTTYEIGELYKIHGCCTKPQSIVINSFDYKKMQQKSAYLSSKILTMFLERPIIFLGYSINDADIKEILESISVCLENDQLNKLKERLIFVEWNDNSEKEDEISERKLNSNNGKTLSMNNVLLTDYSDLYSAILQNEAKYDVKILRRVKSQLYELVKENKPTDKLHIATDIDDDTSDVDFVVGVGVYGQFGNVGYSGIQAQEIFLYALGKLNQIYNVDKLLVETIPTLYKGGRGNYPVCQFLSKCTCVEAYNDRIKSLKREKFSDFNTNTDKSYIDKKGYYNITSIIEYYEENGLEKTLTNIPRMSPSAIDADELYSFLTKALDDYPGLLNASQEGYNSITRSGYKKCVCIWDWLKYNVEANNRLKELQSK